MTELVCPTARRRLTPLAVRVALLIFGTVVHTHPETIEGARGGGGRCFATVALGVATRALGTLVYTLSVDHSTGVDGAFGLANGTVIIAAQIIRASIDTNALLGSTGGRWSGRNASIAGIATGEARITVVYAPVAFAPAGEVRGRIDHGAVTTHLILARP